MRTLQALTLTAALALAIPAASAPVTATRTEIAAPTTEAVAPAAPSDDEIYAATVASIIDNHAGAVVEVRFVQATDFGGQERRADAMVMGLLVRDRLLVVPEAEIQPEFPGFMMSESGEFTSETLRLEASNFRVFIAGRAEPLTARYVSRDGDRGLAWLEIEGDEPLPPPIAPGADCALAPGHGYFGLWRLPARHGAAPTVGPGFIGGATALPFAALIASGPTGPAFDFDARFCGYVVAVTLDDDGAGGNPWQETLLIDAPTLERLTADAAAIATR